MKNSYHMQEMLSKKVIGSRIKDLRVKAGLSQAEVAQNLSISRSNYSQIELGNQFPTFEVLFGLASFYSKTYEWLLHGSSGFFDKKLPEINKKCVKGEPAVAYAHEKEEGRIFLVRSSDREKYIEHSDELNFLRGLETVPVPFRSGNFSLRAFEVCGQSMRNALHPGDILIGRYIGRVEDIEAHEIYIIVTRSEVYVERVIASNASAGIIISVSDADPLDRRILYFDEVREVWKAESKYSKVLCRMVENVSNYINRFESAIFELESEIEKLKTCLPK